MLSPLSLYPSSLPHVSTAFVLPTVEQQAEPSQEYVDQIHSQVVEAVQKLYNKHRHVLPGWEHRDLTIN